MDEAAAAAQENTEDTQDAENTESSQQSKSSFGDTIRRTAKAVQNVHQVSELTMHELILDYQQTHPDEFGHYDPESVTPESTEFYEFIHLLRQLDSKRPCDVTSTAWNSPMSLNERHKTVALMTASGVPTKEISNAVGYSEGRLSTIRKSPEMKQLIEDYRMKLFGRPLEQQFQQFAAYGAHEINEVLDPSRTPEELGLKRKDRVDLAKWAIEHVKGKAPQTIETKNASVVNIMQKIDHYYATQKRDGATLPKNILPKPGHEHLISERPENPIDAWVLDNVETKTFTKDTLQDTPKHPVVEAEVLTPEERVALTASEIKAPTNRSSIHEPPKNRPAPFSSNIKDELE